MTAANDEAPAGAAAGKGTRGQVGTSPDETADRAEIERNDIKRFNTLRAELARRGFQLHIIDAGGGTCAYLIARWDRSREVEDMAAVEAFLQRLGA